MVVTETITINGKEFVKNYSDAGYMIERDGVKYAEAIDPVGFDRVYTESDEFIDGFDGNEEITGDELLEMIEEVI